MKELAIGGPIGGSAQDWLILVKQKGANGSKLSLNILSMLPQPYVFLLISNNKLQTKSKEKMYVKVINNAIKY